MNRSLILLALLLAAFGAGSVVAGESSANNLDPWQRCGVTMVGRGGSWIICNGNLDVRGQGYESEPEKGETGIPTTTIPGKGKGEDLSNRDMSGLDLSGKILGNARMVGSRLIGADLRGTDFGFAFLSNAVLDQADLRGASLVGMNLEGASLRGTDLKDVTLFDGNPGPARPVSFFRVWRSLTIDLLPLPDGTYVEDLNIEQLDDKGYITFLRLEGNGANVKDADFTGAKNLSDENLEYVCRWGGERTRASLGGLCAGIPSGGDNPFAEVVYDSFLAVPQVLGLDTESVRHGPCVQLAFSEQVRLRPDALVLQAENPVETIPLRCEYTDSPGQFFTFYPTKPALPGTYRIVLLSGKALDDSHNFLRGDRVLGRVTVPAPAGDGPRTSEPGNTQAILHTAMLAGIQATAERRLDDAERHFQTMLRNIEEFAPANPELAFVLGCLGEIHLDAERLVVADQFLSRAVELSKQRTFSDSLMTGGKSIRIISNLAKLYRLQGRTEEALWLIDKMPEWLEKTFGRFPQDIAKQLFRSGANAYQQNRYTDAEQLIKLSAEVREAILYREQRDLFTSLEALAQIHRAQGRFVEAESCFLRILTEQERNLGADHQTIADLLDKLAGIRVAMGKYSEAEALYRRSMAIREEHPGTENLSLVTTLEDYSRLLRILGRQQESKKIQVQAKKIQVRHEQRAVLPLLFQP